MNLGIQGESVFHAAYGCGKIIAVKDQMLIVCFEEGCRSFSFPDIFEESLLLLNSEKQRDMDALCRRIRKEKERHLLSV